VVAVPVAKVMVQVEADRVREKVPSVEVVEVPMGGEVPEDAAAPVLFGIPLWSPTIEELLSRGVTWFHLAGTGVDQLPKEAYQGRVVTCARGAAAIPIAEFCLAAMLAAVKQMPEVWLDGPAEQHGMAALGELRGQTPASASRGPEAAVGNDDRFSGEAVVSAAPPSRLEQQSGVRGRIGD